MPKTCKNISRFLWNTGIKTRELLLNSIVEVRVVPSLSHSYVIKASLQKQKNELQFSNFIGALSFIHVKSVTCQNYLFYFILELDKY